MEKWRVIIKPSNCPHRQVLEYGRVSIGCLKLENDRGFCVYADCPLETILNEEVIILRNISDEEATKEIIELFEKTSDHLYYNDVADKLSLDLIQVVRICKELEEKEILVEVDDNKEKK